MNWTNETRRLSDLIPWDRNPRKIGPAQAKRLIESWQEFDQVDAIAIGPDNELYNGHQRLEVLLEHKGPEYRVDVRVASRPLTDKERERLVAMLHRGATGEWDFDALQDWDLGDLLAWGFEPGEFIGEEIPGFSPGQAEAQQRLDLSTAEPEEVEEVTCPHCGETFER